MKVHLDELDKYIKTNKITVYDIYAEGKKQPVYSSSDEQSIDETIDKATETFNSMPSGVYKFRGKKLTTTSNAGYQEVDVLVGNYQQDSVPRANIPNQRMQNFTQEDIDKAIANEKEKLHKDYELKECKRMFEESKKENKELREFVKQLSDDFEELLDTLDLEGIRGKNTGGVTDMVKTAATTALEHGTKSVIDRFANYK